MQQVGLRTYRNFINGTWVESASGKYVDNVNPADTRDVIGRVPLSTAAEVNAAVEAAEAAREGWNALPAPKRGDILFQAVRIMEARKPELARMLTREEGKILPEALGEVQKAINVLEYIAGEGRRIGGYSRASEMPSTFCYTVRVPLGVCALVTPWNFPVAIPVWKIGPALLSGNTVVFKPATLTPDCAVQVVEIFQEAGVPAGVLNLVLGAGREVGEALVAHPAVKAISFTGSNEVGMKLYHQAATRHIKTQCEMGGKNPLVVLADADLALAAEATAQGAFGSTGQRCTATSRAIVEASVADKFVELVLKKAQAVKVGNGLESGINMGPSVDEGQMSKVLEYIAVGQQEGAKMLVGGRRVSDGDLAHGCFVAPTIFDHVKPEMRIAREEIFGPVLSIIRVPDFDAAMQAANGVEYGLTSSIYTRDVGSIFRFIDRIETGITHVNSPTMGGEAQFPFGGMKATGVGHREMNEEAIDFFTEMKAVYIDYTGAKREGFLY
ncbi:MAG: aldehyde dehydrogenase family protein [Candidatus Xenobia bacterium]